MRNKQKKSPLKKALALTKRVAKRRKGKPVTDSVKVLETIRQERISEMLGLTIDS